MLHRLKTLTGCLAAALSALILSTPSVASERYRERPPVVVSPDLNAPWVMQLQGNRRDQPRVHYAPQAQNRRAPQAAQIRPRGAQQITVPQMRQSQQRAQRAQQQATGQHVAPRPRQQVAALSKPNKPKRPKIAPQFLPQVVSYQTQEAPGTIVIDTPNRFLYLVMEDGKARRYGVGVGKPGFEWAGTHKVTRKAEWPDWRPPAEMIAREAKKGNHLPVHMAGGPANPMGARAMYLGSTLYRIHGTNQPWTIGTNTSSGCIRMRNEDVTDLYERVGIGAKVTVR
jgi:lipoprotein-anchoring transpeptidase ErfK/SrfK